MPHGTTTAHNAGPLRTGDAGPRRAEGPYGGRFRARSGVGHKSRSVHRSELLAPARRCFHRALRLAWHGGEGVVVRELHSARRRGFVLIYQAIAMVALVAIC